MTSSGTCSPGQRVSPWFYVHVTLPSISFSVYAHLLRRVPVPFPFCLLLPFLCVSSVLPFYPVFSSSLYSILRPLFVFAVCLFLSLSPLRTFCLKLNLEPSLAYLFLSFYLCLALEGVRVCTTSVQFFSDLGLDHKPWMFHTPSGTQTSVKESRTHLKGRRCTGKDTYLKQKKNTNN